MSLIHTLPKTAKPLVTRNIFTANFNAPTVGVYDFGIAGNSLQTILKLAGNVVYFIDKIDVGATMADGTYLQAQNVLSLLSLRMALKKTKKTIPDNPIPLVNLFQGKELGLYFQTHSKESDDLVGSIVGQLLQPAALIGVPTVSISISMQMYFVADPAFTKSYREKALWGIPTFPPPAG